MLERVLGVLLAELLLVAARLLFAYLAAWLYPERAAAIA